MKKRHILILCMAVTLGASLRADVVLNNNSVVTGGANLLSTPVVGTNGVGSGTAGNPWVYVFSAPFSMGSYRLTTAGDPASRFTTESFRLDLGGNSLSGSGGSMNLVTFGGWSSGKPFNQPTTAGSISIINAGEIAVGTIDAHGLADGCATRSYAGAIGIGQASGTGSGPVGSLSANTLRADFVDVYHYTASGNGAAITIYSTGNVTIAGNIQSSTYNGSGGEINIRHRGSFSAQDLLSSQAGGGSDTEIGGNVTVSGNYTAAGPGGTFQARTIDASYNKGNYGGTTTHRAGGTVIVQGYTGVRVTGNIRTYSTTTGGGSGDNSAGNIAITNVSGDIQIDGGINAKCSRLSSMSGSLTLTAGGAITLASLDLANVKAATLTAPGGAKVTGVLTNFPVGTPASGLLDAPANTVIRYRSRLNPYLGGVSYLLKSGGLLRAEPSGTAVVFK